MSTLDLSTIKALTFDVGGSVFDWQTATRRAVSNLAGARNVEVDDREFCFTWRRRMFEELRDMRHGERERTNADGLHRFVLDELAEAHPQLELSAADRDELTTVWHAMDVWDDVPAALPRLRERYVVSILTVLSLGIVVDSSKHAGIDWDAYISCEFLSHYKPEPEAYHEGARLLGYRPDEVMMVAVHPGDLAAAQRAGMKAAYVAPKLEEMGSAGSTDGFEVIATDYGDLADQICA